MLTQENQTKQNRNNHNDAEQEPSFADLLEQYEPEPMHRGQFVRGTVLHIDQNVILADVDAKRTAIVPPQDLAEIEEDELAQISVGDEVTVYVLRTPVGNEDLLVSLNKGLEQQDWLRAKKHLASEEPLELEIIGYNKGGLMVDFGHLKGFVPASHVPQLQNTRDRQAMLARKAELVGEEMPFQVIEVDRQRRRLVLSARKAREPIQRQRLEALKAREGERVTGRVASLVSFGAFVDLEGIQGLVHVSEIAWQKVDDPAEFLSQGQEIDVLIKAVDLERQRISLSRKALLPNPWTAYAQRKSPGDLAEGGVTGVTDFGVFVRVAEGVEGLLHASEMHGTQDFAPQDLLYQGDKILVRILDIEPQRERLSLSQRRITQREEIEWLQQHQQAAENLSQGEEEE